MAKKIKRIIGWTLVSVTTLVWLVLEVRQFGWYAPLVILGGVALLLLILWLIQ